MTTKKQKEICTIFGRGIENFTKDKFPTTSDVMKNYFYVKLHENIFDKEVRKIVCQRLVDHFKTIDPTAELLTDSRIIRKIQDIYEKKKKLQKNNTQKNQERVKDFKKSCSSIFEIRKIQRAPKEVTIKIVDVKNFKPIGYVKVEQY